MRENDLSTGHNEIITDRTNCDYALGTTQKRLASWKVGKRTPVSILRLCASYSSLNVGPVGVYICSSFAVVLMTLKLIVIKIT